MDPQFGMDLWHGQLVAPSSIICDVMVHGFAIVTLTTGTNARVNESKSATMVRVQDMGSSPHTMKLRWHFGALGSSPDAGIAVFL
jgi:hypothetical protein